MDYTIGVLERFLNCISQICMMYICPEENLVQVLTCQSRERASGEDNLTEDGESSRVSRQFLRMTSQS